MKSKNAKLPVGLAKGKADKRAVDAFERLRELNETIAEKWGGLEEPAETEDIAAAGPKGGTKGKGGGNKNKQTAPSDMWLTNSTVAEDANPGTIIGSIKVADRDHRESFTFSLLDSADGLFSLSGNNVVLSAGRELDFESAESHAITIRVTDKFGLTYTETMQISVADVYEAPVDGEPPAEEPPEEEPPAEEPPAEEPPAEEPPAEEPPAEEPPAEEPPVEEPPAEEPPGSDPVHEVPDYVLEAMLFGNIDNPSYRWNAGDAVGTAVTVSYSFATSLSSDYTLESLPYAEQNAQFTAFNSAQKQAVREIFDAVESFANITFVETSNDAAANISFGSYLMTTEAGGYAYYPGVGGRAGDVWITTRWDTVPDLNAETGGDWARYILAHEIGHALGLDHAHEGGLPESQDGTAHSVMSYHYDHGSNYSMDFQIFDVAALQHLYGANMQATAGDTVHHYNPDKYPIGTIWDAGGHDTLSADGGNRAVVIDLRQGAFSNIGQSSSVSISYGSHIEDAVGGNGNDRITGNEGDNRLDGGLGSDVLTGLAGADTFVIKGNDRIEDFENGIDQIDWQGVEFASLSVTQSGSNALVSDGVNSALLLNTSVADVDSSDFTGAFV